MKKSIIVLLIAVLVAGFAFAGTLKGSASLEFNVDLKKAARTWGFKNASEWAYSFDFEYDTTAVEVNGEGKLWAELAISGSAWIGVEEAGGKTGSITGKYSVELSKANIHIGDDIIIGLLNEGVGKDFAYSYTLDDFGDPVSDYVRDDHETANIGGFTVTYKEWFGGFGAKGTWATDPAEFTFYGHGATPEFKFAQDQVKVQAGGYAAYANNTNVFARASFVGAGAKAEYAADKLNAYVGVDVMYDNGVLPYEALAQATYLIGEKGIVGADAYVVPGAFRGYAGDDKKKPAIDADVYATYTLDVNEEVKVNLFGSVEITDALVADREITAKAVESASVKEFTFALTEIYQVFGKNLMLQARVDYEAEKFSAWAQVDPWISFGDKTTLAKLGVGCGISTTAIIDKAELGLKYTRADFAKVGDAIKDEGLVTAYVTIAFDNTPAEE